MGKSKSMKTKSKLILVVLGLLIESQIAVPFIVKGQIINLLMKLSARQSLIQSLMLTTRARIRLNNVKMNTLSLGRYLRRSVNRSCINAHGAFWSHIFKGEKSRHEIYGNKLE